MSATKHDPAELELAMTLWKIGIDALAKAREAANPKLAMLIPEFRELAPEQRAAWMAVAKYVTAHYAAPAETFTFPGGVA